jgi:hypothetical protein
MPGSLWGSMSVFYDFGRRQITRKLSTDEQHLSRAELGAHGNAIEVYPACCAAPVLVHPIPGLFKCLLRDDSRPEVPDKGTVGSNTGFNFTLLTRRFLC